ncbi:MAG TPA: hypothetical protein VLA12_01765 [Planctomycetaceae bacterium]|nr:hypothetical protein [Planctomycetaceae bacterium]
MLELNVDTRNLQRELLVLRRRKLPRFRTSLIQRVMEQAVDATRDRTPVETGEARDGWDQSNIESIEQSEMSERKLTNRVEHVIYLEYGTRRMEPREMVRRSLAEAAQLVHELARELFKTELE